MQHSVVENIRVVDRATVAVSSGYVNCQRHPIYVKIFSFSACRYERTCTGIFFPVDWRKSKAAGWMLLFCHFAGCFSFLAYPVWCEHVLVTRDDTSPWRPRSVTAAGRYVRSVPLNSKSPVVFLLVSLFAAICPGFGCLIVPLAYTGLLADNCPRVVA